MLNIRYTLFTKFCNPLLIEREYSKIEADIREEEEAHENEQI